MKKERNKLWKQIENSSSTPDYKKYNLNPFQLYKSTLLLLYNHSKLRNIISHTENNYFHHKIIHSKSVVAKCTWKNIQNPHSNQGGIFSDTTHIPVIIRISNADTFGIVKGLAIKLFTKHYGTLNVLSISLDTIHYGTDLENSVTPFSPFYIPVKMIKTIFGKTGKSPLTTDISSLHSNLDQLFIKSELNPKHYSIYDYLNLHEGQNIFSIYSDKHYTHKIAEITLDSSPICSTYADTHLNFSHNLFNIGNLQKNNFIKDNVGYLSSFIYYSVEQFFQISKKFVKC